ncbi:MAG: hypothetical protein K9W43_02370 [Candidatus Thorarchaeota archaeon]|nr:hypothetical protein [Candidatus Thorarchaeota archaeon]
MNINYRLGFVITLLLAMGVTQVNALMSFNPVILNGHEKQTTISWNITDCPDMPFAWGWTDEGKWLAEPGDAMTFAINRTHTDVEGELHLGNFSIYANDTDIARELVLGVWGKTHFFPGLVIEVNDTSIADLNATAYASAAHVKGNYLNGTMKSSYKSMTVIAGTFQCIVFEYEQDPSAYGEPQKTTLAYDLDTGILVWANTSYSFGTPYILTVELSQITTTAEPLSPLVVAGASAGAIVILLIIVIAVKKR